MQTIIGVKRIADNTISFFFKTFDVKVGDRIVVNIDDFITIGEVVRTDVTIEEGKTESIGKILRRATAGDEERFKNTQEMIKEKLKLIKKKSVELGLVMKFVGGEISLDMSKVIILFTSEDRVDFRQLLKDIGNIFKTRIELRQIGQRDEVKICGGVGPCGEPCCCSRFLDNFEHVSVKMAKIQNISLSPTKINGICGRLMCCLAYESKTYEEILAKMPNINSEVMSPNGKGIVVYNDLLRERVSIKRHSDGDNFIVEDFPLDEIKFHKNNDNKNFNKKENKRQN